jgi:hypothetical protein
MSDLDPAVQAPELPAELHPDVAAECRTAWGKGRPWTPIRPLRKGADDPQGASCGGSQGNHHLPCGKDIEGVQYTIQGYPVFYCEQHALDQNQWDKIHYDSKPVWRDKMSEEDVAYVQKLLAKIGRKKKKKEEPQEIDPAA